MSALALAPGFDDVEVSYFDVDERLSAITRGPIAATQQA